MKDKRSRGEPSSSSQQFLLDQHVLTSSLSSQSQTIFVEEEQEGQLNIEHGYNLDPLQPPPPPTTTTTSSSSQRITTTTTTTTTTLPPAQDHSFSHEGKEVKDDENVSRDDTDDDFENYLETQQHSTSHVMIAKLISFFARHWICTGILFVAFLVGIITGSVLATTGNNDNSPTVEGGQSSIVDSNGNPVTPTTTETTTTTTTTIPTATIVPTTTIPTTTTSPTRTRTRMTLTPTLVPTISFAPTPEVFNDACTRAIGPLFIGRQYRNTANTSQIHYRQNPTIPSCDRSSSSSSSSNDAGFWYTVTGGDEVIRAHTCNNTMNVDTKISIYTGSCEWSDAISTSTSTSTTTTGNIFQQAGSSITTTSNIDLTCVAYNDDFCGQQSSISWFAKKGVNYYIYVHGLVDEITGDILFQDDEDEEVETIELRVQYENNGECVDAIGPIVPSNGEEENPAAITIGSMRGASTQPLFTCDFQTAVGGHVWYWLYGTGTWMVASTCDNDFTEFGARLDVVAGDDCSTATCATVRDSDCGTGFRIIWKSEQDVRYNLLVYKNSLLNGTNFGLSLKTFEPVENDNCINAMPITANSGSPVIGSTLEATFDTDVEPCGEAIRQPGVWYSVIGTGSTMLASTCNDETNFSTEISIYQGNCSSGALECVSYSKQFCNEKGSVYWNSEDGAEYYIFVRGADYGSAPNTGHFSLTVDDFVTEQNDICADAIRVSISNETISGSTFSATPDSATYCNGPISEAPGVWYTVVGNGNTIRASTCDPATTFDTQISIFTGSCGSLRCIITDDNSCGLQSSVAWSATQDTIYYILVHGRRSSSVGDFSLIVEEYNPLMINDFCNGSIDPPVNGSIVLGSTRGATFDNEGTCGAPNTGPGVWYRVKGTGKRITASLCNEETDFDTAISVFSGDCVNHFCVTGNADSGKSECRDKSEVGFLTTPNTMYYILIHGYDIRTGNFGLSVDEPEPLVENDFCVDATPLQLSGAVINASNIGATRDDVPVCQNVLQTGPGIWYKVTGNGERLVAKTCGSENNPLTELDTKISVYKGSCGNYTCVVGDDDYCGRQSRVVWLSELDETYYVLVHGTVEGRFGLIVNEFQPDRTNDFCTAAQGPMLPNGQVVTGSTVASSFDEAGECGAKNTSPGVWFFVVGTGERLTADTCSPETNFDTKLSIFTGSNCFDLTCVAGNDDGCGFQSSISWDSQIGVFYWILLHGWDTDGVGSYGLRVSGSILFG